MGLHAFEIDAIPMITVIFPHRAYSENKLKIKQIIKKYGMSWNDKKSGWVNDATGDGVFIDKSVMEMIMDDAFSEEQPMTLFVNSANEDFIKESRPGVPCWAGNSYSEAQRRCGPRRCLLKRS